MKSLAGMKKPITFALFLKHKKNCFIIFNFKQK